jgi:hypothetical protein
MVMARVSWRRRRFGVRVSELAEVKVWDEKARGKKLTLAVEFFLSEMVCTSDRPSEALGPSAVSCQAAERASRREATVQRRSILALALTQRGKLSSAKLDAE